MSPADYARASREAQGLPPTIEDPAVLDRVAVILTAEPAGQGVADAA